MLETVGFTGVLEFGACSYLTSQLEISVHARCAVRELEGLSEVGLRGATRRPGQSFLVFEQPEFTEKKCA